MVAQKEDKYSEKAIKENIVMEFVGVCLDKGMEVNGIFGLLNELITLIKQKQFEEHIWQGLIDKAIAEANNKEGATL
ncbi:hypothetical protein P4T54_16855 [Bacillus mycoides]|uniref:hypothetical protein n=1 Tax=Bacillus mycoides TaxID=1405 RepID=UPI002E1E3005|nr:hypothetical protein [Bacillus mycoides]